LPDEDEWPESDLIRLIDTGRFFDELPRTSLYNVIGGEPLISPHTIKLLQFLKSNGIYVRLWTHGLVASDVWRWVAPWVDEVMLYIPAPDANEYREITGSDEFETLHAAIQDLKELKIPVSLNAHITPLTVAWLPYFHDLAREWNCSMLVNYYAFDELNSTEVDYIHRYNWVLNTVTVRLKRRHRSTCPGVPHEGLHSNLEMGRLWAKRYVDRLRGYFGV
jgi:MoaA/NifB/PqqE/SkfB family radical SAM enzyme